MEKATAVNTCLGVLKGRDCIYLDQVKQDGLNNLTFTGDINGHLVSQHRDEKDWFPYTLTFRRVLAYFSCELDTYKNMAGTEYIAGSSFDLIEDSTWLKSLPVREDFDKGIYRHYRLFTYDDVYNIIAVSYEFAMIKERIPISGDLKSKVKQLMEYAGWQEGRKVDISIAEKYYAEHGAPMMKTTQRFYRKYFGLCCEWYLEQEKLNWAADFQFALFPFLVNGIKSHLEDAYFRDMSGCELAEIEHAAGEKCQPIGHIGYYYPAEVWISEYGKLYAKYEYQDEIECFPDVFALIERDLRQCKFDSAAMKTVEALDGKL